MKIKNNALKNRVTNYTYRVMYYPHNTVRFPVAMGNKRRK